MTGARELRREIKRAEDKGLADALKMAYRDSSTIVAQRSKINAPWRSGDLRSSIRPLGGASKAVVAAGRGRTNAYAGVIHYGWPARNITAQPFIHEALKSEWDLVYATFEDALADLADELSTK